MKEGVMSGEGLLIILVVGLIAGWLAGQIVQGTGFGLVGDLIIGIVGAFIGGWLLPQLGIHLGVGIVAAIINEVAPVSWTPELWSVRSPQWQESTRPIRRNSAGR